MFTSDFTSGQKLAIYRIGLFWGPVLESADVTRAAVDNMVELLNYYEEHGSGKGNISQEVSADKKGMEKMFKTWYQFTHFFGKEVSQKQFTLCVNTFMDLKERKETNQTVFEFMKDFMINYAKQNDTLPGTDETKTLQQMDYEYRMEVYGKSSVSNPARW